MKLVLRGLAAIVLATTTFACAVPTEGAEGGADQQDQVQVAAGHEAVDEPGLQPQNVAPPTPCNDAQWQVAYDDNWVKRGPTAKVLTCNYNPSSGYVVYTYEQYIWT
jgi:hypothetical protein